MPPNPHLHVAEQLPQDAEEQALQAIREESCGQTPAKERQHAFGSDNLLGGGPYKQSQDAADIEYYTPDSQYPTFFSCTWRYVLTTRRLLLTVSDTTDAAKPMNACLYPSVRGGNLRRERGTYKEALDEVVRRGQFFRQEVVRSEPRVCRVSRAEL